MNFCLPVPTTPHVHPCLSLTLLGLPSPRRLSAGSSHRRGRAGDGGCCGDHGDGAPRSPPAHGHALRPHEEHLRGHCDPGGGAPDIHRGGESFRFISVESETHE